jgi:hypothetical protein
LLGALPAVADTIYQTAGTESVQYAINTSEAIAISWTSTVGYSNVSIGVSLSDGLNTDTDVFEAGEAFLLDSIGSGTTEAAVLAYTTFNFPHGPQDQQLFAGVILNPGTYYLLLDSSSSVGGGWQATDTPDGLTVTVRPRRRIKRGFLFPCRESDFCSGFYLHVRACIRAVAQRDWYAYNTGAPQRCFADHFISGALCLAPPAPAFLAARFLNGQSYDLAV